MIHVSTRKNKLGSASTKSDPKKYANLTARSRHMPGGCRHMMSVGCTRNAVDARYTCIHMHASGAVKHVKTQQLTRMSSNSSQEPVKQRRNQLHAGMHANMLRRNACWVPVKAACFKRQAANHKPKPNTTKSQQVGALLQTRRVFCSNASQILMCKAHERYRLSVPLWKMHSQAPDKQQGLLTQSPITTPQQSANNSCSGRSRHKSAASSDIGEWHACACQRPTAAGRCCSGSCLLPTFTRHVSLAQRMGAASISHTYTQARST